MSRSYELRPGGLTRDRLFENDYLTVAEANRFRKSSKCKRAVIITVVLTGLLLLGIIFGYFGVHRSAKIKAARNKTFIKEYDLLVFDPSRLSDKPESLRGRNLSWTDGLLVSAKPLFKSRATFSREFSCDFLCANGLKCIPKDKVCDNKVDCLPRGEDEYNCTCKQRIPKVYRCDKVVDCPDASDEQNCTQCEGGGYLCPDGTGCYSREQLCDDRVQCQISRTDESTCLVLGSQPSAKVILPRKSQGYLHKIVRGISYPLCSNSSDPTPLVFSHIACSAVFKQDTGAPKVEFRLPDASSDVQYISTNGIITNYCRQRLVHAVCQTPNCPLLDHDSELQVTYHSNEKDGRIVGGRKSPEGEWPTMAALYKNGTFICGASVLDEEWVITAAHCFIGLFHTDLYEVKFGMLRRTSFSPYTETRNVSYIALNEHFNHFFQNDVALLKLDRPVLLNRHIQRVCLPPPDFKLPLLCVVIGWGDLFEDGVGPDQLQEVVLPTLESCPWIFTKDDLQVCAGEEEGGIDACQGDSGGPLMCPSKDGKLYLSGIISSGIGCARPNSPGLYTRVTSYLKWIVSNSTKENCKKASTGCDGIICDVMGQYGVKCLLRTYICDGTVNCLGAEDENYCTVFGFDENAFRNRAIPSIFLRNNVAERRLNCSEKQFSCVNDDHCISSNLVCDGIPQCADGSDERSCSCLDFVIKKFPSLICDGHINCLDGSDEENCTNLCPSDNIYDPVLRTCTRIACDLKNPSRSNCFALHDADMGSSIFPHIRFPLSSSGIVLHYRRGEWKQVCEQGTSDVDGEKICENLQLGQMVERVAASAYNTLKVLTNCPAIHLTCAGMDCGIRAYEYPNNITTGPGVTPWTALLLIDGIPECSGTIVGDNDIIVPYYCYSEINVKRVIRVRVGVHMFLGWKQYNEQDLRILWHRAIPQGTLLKTTAIKKNAFVNSVCIHSDPSEYGTCVLSGLGFNNSIINIPVSPISCGKNICVGSSEPLCLKAKTSLLICKGNQWRVIGALAWGTTGCDMSIIEFTPVWEQPLILG